MAKGSEDKDLELILAKKMIKLKKKMLQQKERKEPTPREILVSRLVDRGIDVLEAAERDYPYETKIIVEKLAQLIKDGTIEGYISGGQLLTLFKTLGLNVRIETTIKVEKDGKFVPLSEKLREDIR
jgi:DNA-binding TFAR19-related protein (PDSD5 family)